LDGYKARHPEGQTQLIGYIPRPFIRVRPDQNAQMRSYSFYDAVTSLDPMSPEPGLSMQDSDFLEAYISAGQRFSGNLQSLFIVLSDTSPLVGHVRKPAPSFKGIGRSFGAKRPQDEEMESNASKHSRTRQLSASLAKTNV